MHANYHIVILSYNHPQLTGQTIDSVLSFGFSPSQIHLVHNGSLKQHEAVLVEKYPSIVHMVLPTNIGFSGGANFGLKTVFEITTNILFLTNDTEVLTLPEIFPKNLPYFSVAILKRNTVLIDSIMGAVNLKTGHLSHLKEPGQIQSPETFIKTYVPGTAFGMTKVAFEKLKGFDESLHTYWEDVELSLRAHQEGVPIGFSSLIKVKHKIGKTCHKDRFYTLFLFQRNRKRILKRFGVDHYKFSFYWKYACDMLKIANHILAGPNKKTNFRLWWKAIYD